MGMMDGIMNRFHVGMVEDDDLDDYDDDLDDDFEEDEEQSGGFLSGLFGGRKRSDDEEDEMEDEQEAEPVRNTSFKRYAPTPKTEKPVVKPTENKKPVENNTRTFAGPASSDRRQVQENSNTRTGGARVIPMSKVVGNAGSVAKVNAELYMIKPKTEEDARIAVDQLLSGRIVVINLEGLNLEIAQYVTDFVTGANYSIGGNFSTINSQVLVFAPSGVNMTGAFDDGQTDSMRDF